LSSTEVRDGLCGICPAGCWVRAEIQNGRLRSVEALPGHPLGTVCRIGQRSAEVVHDPQRLLYPQRRKGPKGTYQFERISWDEALGTIVDRLQALKRESGPESAAIYTGRGSFDMAMCDLFQPEGVAVSSASSVLFPFGSPNTLGVGALCYVSFAMIAPHVTLGEMYITMDTEIDSAELIVVWGANPATDSPPLVHRQILAARQRGAEVVVIDPRRSETCVQAGAEWVPLRPGTDAALALGLIDVLIEEELHDEGFARDWTVGFDELAQMAQHYRPEVVEGITGVPAAQVRSLARRIASARGACPVMYSGLEYSDSGVQAIRAVLILWALAGQLDVPGGLVIRMRENVFPQNRSGLVANPDLRRALGRDRFPVYSMYRGESHAIALPRAVLEGDPYRIRGLLVLGGSIITSWPQPELWKRTLAALDLLVCIDRYPTADAAYADILLPAATGYEITSYMRYGPLFKIRERMVEPQGESRNDFLILAELAARLGYGHLYPQTEEEVLRHALAGTPFTLEAVRAAGGSVQLDSAMMQYKKWEKGLLRADGQAGFSTPTGKLEIASTVLAEHGYQPLPAYTEPGEGPLSQPALAERFPLVFNSGSRTYYDFRSQHHGVPGLARSLPEPFVVMNTSDAAEREIRDGDLVEVSTPRGRQRFAARVTDDIVRGAVDAAMGGGGPLGSKAWRECNVNELTDIERFDPISGFPVYKTLLCQVEKVEARDGGEIRPLGVVEETPQVSPPPVPARQVYLDNSATTAVAKAVVEAMGPFFEETYGNPSSVHTQGGRARDAVEAARRSVAHLLNCTARRIVFTGSGSESDNLAIKGAALARRGEGRHVVTSAIEHPAVLATCRALQAQGFELTVLEVDSDGRVDPERLRRVLRDDTVLVSIMMANNELGTLQPVAELCRLARERGALFHTDAVQAFAKVPIDVVELGVDLLSISAHKIHGPKGVGALYVRGGVDVVRQTDGGGHERGLRAGTENVPGIVGLAKAAELAGHRLRHGAMAAVARLRDRLERGVAEIVSGAHRNGHPEERLPNVLNMTLPGIRGESLVFAMDRRGVAFSSGSACRSGHPEPSHVLKAIGLSDEEAHCSVRFSFSADTTAEDVDYALLCLTEIVRDTTSGIRFVSCR
jgi:cysteine desulfurase NifS